MNTPEAGYDILAALLDCENDFTVPSVEFQDCEFDIEQNKSEIAGIIVVQPDATDPTVSAITVADPSSLTEWETHFADPAVSHLYVIGNLDAPETEERQISRGRTIDGDNVYTLPFNIDETNDTNYEALRAYQSKPEVFIWFYTLGNKIYGGTKGIKCVIGIADLILARGQDAYEDFSLAAMWKAKGLMPRTTSPFTLNS